MANFSDFELVLIAIGLLGLLIFMIILPLIRFVLPKAIEKEEIRTNPCRKCRLKHGRRLICDGCYVKLRREYENGRNDKRNSTKRSV